VAGLHGLGRLLDPGILFIELFLDGFRLLLVSTPGEENDGELLADCGIFQGIGVAGWNTKWFLKVVDNILERMGAFKNYALPWSG